MATAMVFVGVLVPLGELGLGAAIIQRTEIDDDLVSKVFGVVLAISVTLSVLLYSAAGLIANAFDEIRLIPVIEVLSLGLLISSFAVVPRALLTREIDFRSQSIVDMVSNLLGGVVVLVLALEGYAVWALVWSYIILTAVRSVGLNICAARLRWPRSGIGALVSYGAWLTLANFAWLISVHIDTLLVSKLLGMNPLGFYSVGKQLAHLPQSKIQGILNNVCVLRIQSDPGQSDSRARPPAQIRPRKQHRQLPDIPGHMRHRPRVRSCRIGREMDTGDRPVAVDSQSSCQSRSPNQ